MKLILLRVCALSHLIGMMAIISMVLAGLSFEFLGDTLSNNNVGILLAILFMSGLTFIFGMLFLKCTNCRKSLLLLKNETGSKAVLELYINLYLSNIVVCNHCGTLQSDT